MSWCWYRRRKALIQPVPQRQSASTGITVSRATWVVSLFCSDRSALCKTSSRKLRRRASSLAVHTVGFDAANYVDCHHVLTLDCLMPSAVRVCRGATFGGPKSSPGGAGILKG